MRRLGILQTGATLALLALSAGCQTTIGNYFGNRARDFGECFRLQTGFGPGVGVSVSAAGLVHVGLGAAAYPRSLGVGWKYGDGYAFGLGESGDGWDGVTDLTAIFPLASLIHVVASPEIGHAPIMFFLFPPHWETEARPEPTIRAGPMEHGCWLFLPGVVTVTSEPPDPEGDYSSGEIQVVWASEPRPHIRWRRVHAFDVEVSVFAIFTYVRAGFSPGKFLDFLLGWVGIDIAGDDIAVDDMVVGDVSVDEWVPPRPEGGYRPILESPSAPPGDWSGAAYWALRANDPRCLEWFLRAMSRAQHEEDALDFIVSMGDDAVSGLVNVATHPRTNPDPREAARKALEALLGRGSLSASEKSRARLALERDE